MKYLPGVWFRISRLSPICIWWSLLPSKGSDTILKVHTLQNNTSSLYKPCYKIIQQTQYETQRASWRFLRFSSIGPHIYVCLRVPGFGFLDNFAMIVALMLFTPSNCGSFLLYLIHYSPHSYIYFWNCSLYWFSLSYPSLPFLLKLNK